MSYYLGLHRCPRRVSLAQRFKTLDGEDLDDSDYSIVGRLFHKLMEHYALDSFPDVAVEHESLVENLEYAEALRLYQGFREHYPTSDFGEVVGAEVQLPRNELEAKLVRETYGYDATGRLDLVSYLDADACDFVRQTRKLPLPGPGVYIWDHKVKSQRSKLLFYEWMLAPQFAWYPMLWDLLNPERPCRGVIVNGIVRHKTLDPEKSFPTLFIEKPDVYAQEMVKSIFASGQKILKDLGPDFANPAHCFDWHRVCPFLENGSCDRTNK